MDSGKAYELIDDTHGLYIPMKKYLFRGEYLKKPEWMKGISDRAKKICLLLGKWEETEGDKQIIETLYGKDYESFLEEILPYAKGEDPFLHMVKTLIMKGFYRDYMVAGTTTNRDIQAASVGYLRLLLKNMDFSVER